MTADQSDKDHIAQDELENDSSTDWEEAFQAEDYLISPETPPPTLSESLAGDGIKKNGEAARGRASGGASGSSGLPGRLGILFEGLGGNTFIRSLTGHFPASLRQGPVLSSAKRRGALIALTVVLCCLLLLALSLRTGRQQAQEEYSASHLAEGGLAGGKKQAVVPAAPATKPVSAAKSTPPATVSSPPAVASTAGGKNSFTAGTVRRKWRFSSFLIDAAQSATEPPSYVVVDLSLVLRLNAGEPFPEDKKYAVREMIYQFFSNRPLYELRRFSLARGEMQMKLEAWFHKEWPNNPIESIFFHRYQIL